MIVPLLEIWVLFVVDVDGCLLDLMNSFPCYSNRISNQRDFKWFRRPVSFGVAFRGFGFSWGDLWVHSYRQAHVGSKSFVY